jgi:MarR family transcriptional repressor of emrRAB
MPTPKKNAAVKNAKNSTEMRFCRLLSETGDLLRELAFGNVTAKDPDVTMRQHLLLRTLCILTEEHPAGITLKNLAAAAQLTAGTASELVEQLVQRGVLCRRAHPDDRRKVLITPTPELEAMRDSGIEKMAELTRRTFTDCSAKQLAVMLGCLDKIKNKLKQIQEERLCK